MPLATVLCSLALLVGDHSPLGARRTARWQRVSAHMSPAATAQQKEEVGGPFEALAVAVTASKCGAFNKQLNDAPDKEAVLSLVQRQSGVHLLGKGALS